MAAKTLADIIWAMKADNFLKKIGLRIHQPGGCTPMVAGKNQMTPDEWMAQCEAANPLEGATPNIIQDANIPEIGSGSISMGGMRLERPDKGKGH